MIARGLPPGTRVRVVADTEVCPAVRTGTIVLHAGEAWPPEEDSQRRVGGYLVRHDGDEPGPFGWGYNELERIPGMEQLAEAEGLS